MPPSTGGQMNSRVQLNMKLTGFEKVQRTLDELREMRAVPNILGKAVVAGIRETFDKSVDPNTGQKWAALKSRAGKPLVNSGRLRRSIHYLARQNGITVGTNFAYAHVHQWGMTIRPRTKPFLVFEVFGVVVRAKKVNIPARAFMPDKEEGLRRVTHDGDLIATVEQYFKKIDTKGN